MPALRLPRPLSALLALFVRFRPGRTPGRGRQGGQSSGWSVALLLCLAPLTGWCGETVDICYNWSCANEAPVSFTDPVLAGVALLLRDATSAADERERIALAVGRLYAEAARQSPIGADRPGNGADAESDGRMDCIDHSTSTTRLLRMMEARGWLRWHKVLEPARRAPFLVNQHYAALLEETDGPPPAALAPAPPRRAPAVPDYIPAMLALCDCQAVLADLPAPPPPPVQPERHPGGRYVVDSWFVLPGAAPLVLPLANWLKGEGPDVD